MDLTTWDKVKLKEIALNLSIQLHPVSASNSWQMGANVPPKDPPISDIVDHAQVFYTFLITV